MEEVGVTNEECSAYVAHNLRQHGCIATYPSSLGEKSDLVMKQRLTLFLVCISAPKWQEIL